MKVNGLRVGPPKLHTTATQKFPKLECRAKTACSTAVRR